MASFATGCKGHVFSCDRTSCRRRVKVSCSNGSKDTSSRRLPVVILPGFLSNNTTAPDSQYRELQQNLLQLGHPEAGMPTHRSTCTQLARPLHKLLQQPCHQCYIHAFMPSILILPMWQVMNPYNINCLAVKPFLAYIRLPEEIL
eukprot:GHRR01015523.1.p2 GENE.GHRR01015523.1~~GHRR01015523.1.p2  ORF type:complete len:145 (-),score=25.45 GHRR01015523.1:2536-2970(-)